LNIIDRRQRTRSFPNKEKSIGNIGINSQAFNFKIIWKQEVGFTVLSLYSAGKGRFLDSFECGGARASVTLVARNEISLLTGIEPLSNIPCTATWSHLDSFISTDATDGVRISRICLLNYKQTALKSWNIHVNAVLYKVQLAPGKKDRSF
jgi:hypothetical protein